MSDSALEKARREYDDHRKAFCGGQSGPCALECHAIVALIAAEREDAEERTHSWWRASIRKFGDLAFGRGKAADIVVDRGGTPSMLVADIVREAREDAARNAVSGMHVRRCSCYEAGETVFGSGDAPIESGNYTDLRCIKASDRAVKEATK